MVTFIEKQHGDRLKKKRFSLLELIIAISSFGLASAAFNRLRYYAISYDGRANRTLWPSDASVIESVLLILLMALLIFMPLNAIIRKPQGSMFKINYRYLSLIHI